MPLSDGSSRVIRKSVGGNTTGMMSDVDSIATGGDIFDDLSDKGDYVVRTSKHNKKKEVMDSLTSSRHRVKFTSLEEKGTLYGRETEKATLIECLDSLVLGCEEVEAGKDGRRSLVLVKGYSGSGKTALVSSTLKAQVEGAKGLYVTGKYDLYLRDAQPYYGISVACRQICQEILSLRGKFLKDIQQHMSSEISSDMLPLLLPLMPELADIVIASPKNTTTAPMSNSNSNQDASGSHSSRRRTTTIKDSSRGSQRKRMEDASHVGTGKQQQHPQQEAQRANTKFNYVFRVFMRVVTSYYSPLCVVLDDLQWVDAGSLDLLQFLLTDQENSNLMVVGLYRSNEVEMETEDGLSTKRLAGGGGDGSGEAAHYLTKFVTELEKKIKDDDGAANLAVATIEVGNLEVAAVRSILMDLLAIDDDEKTNELASLCHKRTQGNVFFLISFLAMLEEEGFLSYDVCNGTLEWDIETIKTKTGAASNIVELMKKKMVKLQESYGLLLSLTACLGSTFNLAKLRVVWEHFANEESTKRDSSGDSLEQRLSYAVQDGFLEFVSKSQAQCRWVHDKIQEAALELIPETERSQFKWHLGLCLCEQLCEEDLDSSIFLVVNLLNETDSNTLDREQRIHLANLNLQATQKAVLCSAFSSSAKYARIGVELLPNDSWSTHYTLTLELFSFAVEAEDFIGNDHNMKSYCDKVLNQKLCPLADKLRVYNVLASNIAKKGKYVEAMELVQKVLFDMNVKLPTSRIGQLLETVVGLVKVKLTAGSRTAAEIDELPIMEDQHQLETMRLLYKLSVFSWLCGSDLCAVSVIRSMKLSLRKGLCEFSPPAFGTMSVVLTGILSDLKTSAKVGKYALMLVEKLDNKEQLSATQMVVGTFCLSWTTPFQNVCTLLFDGYRNGMATGDAENAMYCILIHMCLQFMTGQPLSQLDTDFANYTRQMKELKQQQAVDFTATLWQPTHNLMGLSPHPTIVQGSVIPDEKAFLDLHTETPLVLAILRAEQLRLYVTFGEFEKGADLFAAHAHDFIQAGPGHPLYMATMFCGGVCCYATARSKKRGRHKRNARKARSTIRGWVKQGNPNLKHCLALLDAENAALGRNSKRAEQYYQSAISMAARGGFQNDVALSNERYGQFLLSVISDTDGAKYHFEQATKYYEAWGAKKKVDLLKEEHALP